MSYFVQLELNPTGSSTGAIQFDMEQVAFTRLMRQNGNLVKFEMHLRVGNAVAPMIFEGEQADVAYEAWKDFQTREKMDLRYIAPQAKPGVVLIPEVVGG